MCLLSQKVKCLKCSEGTNPPDIIQVKSGHNLILDQHNYSEVNTSTDWSEGDERKPFSLWD